VSPEDLAAELLRRGCILFGEFTLTSGLKSPYYIDLRIAPSHPDLFRAIVDLYRRRIEGLEADVVVGVAVSGLPIASAVAYSMSKPLAYVRGEAKKHGTGRVFEGSVERGWRGVIVDDVATTGSSIERAADAARREGLVVEDAVVLVDREQGASERLAKAGIRLHAIFRVTDVMDVLLKRGLIDRATYDRVVEYVRGCRGP